jgi:phosphoribosylformimino-5-aminoimidazole carboxamide ribonucleotide (ProFAR) isomerase
MIALDTEGGKILVRGWQDKLRLRPEEVIPELEKYASGFLCTYVDAEGTMRGTNLAWFRALRRATRRPITAAGGIRSRARNSRPGANQNGCRRGHGALYGQAFLKGRKSGLRRSQSDLNSVWRATRAISNHGSWWGRN